MGVGPFDSTTHKAKMKTLVAAVAPKEAAALGLELQQGWQGRGGPAAVVDGPAVTAFSARLLGESWLPSGLRGPPHSLLGLHCTIDRQPPAKRTKLPACAGPRQ